MARKTQLDRAIEKVDEEIAQLQAVRDRLVRQRDEERAKRAVTP